LAGTALVAMRTDQAGVASAVFTASREVAGLLGITVIGAVLTSRQGAALAEGHTPVDAFLSGYQAGLLLAAVLVMAGGVAAFASLRRAHMLPEVTDREELVLAG